MITTIGRLMGRTATALGQFGGEVILGLLTEEPSGNY